ncbi:hypothetical protein PR202_gb08633 [Eleusine coracana subsp. coracana]|uniref:C2 domain-containing protein n=1 Tax=Eleusine coracana subsp. coracana TaxID=191504 RepID=A0AAV5EF63_ELECO|nr:hypothetical protein QOZ80_2BG0187810 [Eleusine coracana subsp. coracana]GJN21177.1 hypothetical protein PR202_gb08633 [Eleusine coracana subsp. coracana]
MELLRRRPEPSAIDITWVSCRGVKSPLPFHKPCLYASIFVVSSSSATSTRRRHRVKTPTDRSGGENPDWDAPLRLYLPDAASPEPSEAAAGGKNNKKDDGSDVEDEVLFVKFELKAEVAVLGDVHTASAAVPVPDLVADGRTRRVSYQLVGPDGRGPNGVVSFSYAFHERNGDDDGMTSGSDSEPATPTPPCCPITPAVAVSSPPATIAAAAPRLYPEIEWTLTAEQPLVVYPPVTVRNNTNDFTVAPPLGTRYYPPVAFPPLLPSSPPVNPTSVYPLGSPVDPASVYSPVSPVDPASVYPPSPVPETTTSSRSVYPKVEEPAKASALYPTVDLDPVSYYYPAAPAYGVGLGYAAAPGWGDPCFYG